MVMDRIGVNTIQAFVPARFKFKKVVLHNSGPLVVLITETFVTEGMAITLNTLRAAF